MLIIYNQHEGKTYRTPKFLYMKYLGHKNQLLDRCETTQLKYCRSIYTYVANSYCVFRPTPETDRPITVNDLYLCDSGAQFRLVTGCYSYNYSNNFHVARQGRSMQATLNTINIKYSNSNITYENQ